MFIDSFKTFLFTDAQRYVKKPDTYCTQNKKMSSTNINDAKKECATNPTCFVFYDSKGAGEKFYACDNTTTIKDSTVGSILYQVPLGNKIYAI